VTGYLKNISRESRTAYLLILPAFSVVFILAAYSAFWLIRMSLNEWIFGKPAEEAVWVGLENYRWLLFNPNTTLWASVRITVIYVVICLGIELVLGFMIALILNGKIFARSIYTAILIIPIVVMPTMVGMVFRLYFSYDGLVNYFVQTMFGTKLNWYGPELALLAVILVDIWQYTPFFVLILLAGLQALPRDPYEAARVDGASVWQLFRFVTLPMMAPLIVTVTLLRLMELLRAFDVIFVMFAGGPGDATTTLPLLVYKTTLVARNVGRGSAASVLLIITITALSFILIRLFERVRFEM
jgi:multiple sugar transport system permease protein